MGGLWSNSSDNSNISNDIQTIIKSNDIVVFSWRLCPYCIQAKKILSEKGLNYSDIIVSDAQLKELIKLTSQDSVPSIWIKDTFIGGCNDGPESWMGLTQCIRTGKFDELLKSERVN